MRGLLVRGTYRGGTAEKKKHDDKQRRGDNERGGGSAWKRVAGGWPIGDVKCRPRGLTSGPRMDFYFILIIVTPGKRPPPVISLPPRLCLSRGPPVSHTNVWVTYIRLCSPPRVSYASESADYYGIIFTTRSAYAT